MTNQQNDNNNGHSNNIRPQPSLANDISRLRQEMHALIDALRIRQRQERRGLIRGRILRRR